MVAISESPWLCFLNKLLSVKRGVLCKFMGYLNTIKDDYFNDDMVETINFFIVEANFFIYDYYLSR